MFNANDTIHFGDSYDYYGVIIGPKLENDSYPVEWRYKSNHKRYTFYRCNMIFEKYVEPYDNGLFKVGDKIEYIGKTQDFYGVVTNPYPDHNKMIGVKWYDKKTNTEIKRGKYATFLLMKKYEEKKEEKMSPLTINWGAKTLKFDDLAVRETFVIDTPLSHGTVYMKIEAPKNGGTYQLELGTGKAFPATQSPVKRVDAELNVASPQPK